MKRIGTIVLVAVALLGVAAVGYHLLDARFREWNRRVESVQEFARNETARADSNAAVAARERTRADSLVNLPSVVDTVRIDSLIVEAPDTCGPLVAVIEDLVDENARLREAYDTLASSADRLRVNYDALLVVNDSLMAVLDDRPLPPPKWLPSLRVGPQLGVNMDGHVRAGVGITIAWEIPIPWP